MATIRAPTERTSGRCVRPSSGRCTTDRSDQPEGEQQTGASNRLAEGPGALRIRRADLHQVVDPVGEEAACSQRRRDLARRPRPHQREHRGADGQLPRQRPEYGRARLGGARFDTGGRDQDGGQAQGQPGRDQQRRRDCQLCRAGPSPLWVAGDVAPRRGSPAPAPRRGVEVRDVEGSAAPADVRAYGGGRRRQRIRARSLMPLHTSRLVYPLSGRYAEIPNSPPTGDLRFANLGLRARRAGPVAPVLQYGHGGVAAVERHDAAARDGSPPRTGRGLESGFEAENRRSHIWSGRHSPWKMWPPVRPMRASTSGGPSTWRCMTHSATSGANRAMAVMARSAIASRRLSQSPWPSRYGTYWAKTLMAWRPGGATEGS